jgi:hypothetical protein
VLVFTRPTEEKAVTSKDLIRMSAISIIALGVILYAAKSMIERAQESDVFVSFGLNLGYQLAWASFYLGILYFVVFGLAKVRDGRVSVKIALGTSVLVAAALFEIFWLDDFVRQLAQPAS